MRRQGDEIAAAGDGDTVGAHIDGGEIEGGEVIAHAKRNGGHASGKRVIAVAATPIQKIATGIATGNSGLGALG